MAKKKRHSQTRRPPRVPYSSPEGAPGRAVPPPRVPPPPDIALSEEVAKAPEETFAYVRKDLRRIAILAVLIFGVQLALKIWMGA